jgi:hypothetical protein
MEDFEEFLDYDEVIPRQVGGYLLGASSGRRYPGCRGLLGALFYY